MTVQIKTSDGIKNIVNVAIVRHPNDNEDTTYNFVCIDSFNQKRYFNDIVMIRG